MEKTLLTRHKYCWLALLRQLPGMQMTSMPPGHIELSSSLLDLSVIEPHEGHTIRLAYAWICMHDMYDSQEFPSAFIVNIAI